MPPADDRQASRCVPAAADIRPHAPGDMGWVIGRHGALYHAEYDFDRSFEALVARIAADFIDNFDPARDCSRIAWIEGRIAGSAFVVRQSDEVAKLRLVIVEPWARGTGLGRRLVEDCMGFARDAGYTRMTLWTQDILVPARDLYRSFGFAIVSENPVTAFGREMVEEVWERAL